MLHITYYNTTTQTIVKDMTLPLIHPFSAIVAGPSSSGKSYWVAKLLSYSNVMITPKPISVILCYTEWQPLYDTMKNVKFHKGLIDIDTIDPSVPNLLICDDMMELCNQNIAEVFTKHSHHRNLSILFLTQNLYQKGQHMRNMNLNSSYLILFKNPREVNQVSYLARQMYPKGQSHFLQQAFKDATSVPYGYLFIDLKQTTPEFARIRTGIFPDESTYIYTHKDSAISFERFALSMTDHD